MISNFFSFLEFFSTVPCNMICMKKDLQPSLEVLSDLNFEGLEIHLNELVKCKMKFRFLEHMEDKVFDLWNPMIWRLRKVDGPEFLDLRWGPSTFIYFRFFDFVHRSRYFGPPTLAVTRSSFNMDHIISYMSSYWWYIKIWNMLMLSFSEFLVSCCHLLF